MVCDRGMICRPRRLWVLMMSEMSSKISRRGNGPSEQGMRFFASPVFSSHAAAAASGEQTLRAAIKAVHSGILNRHEPQFCTPRGALPARANKRSQQLGVRWMESRRYLGHRKLPWNRWVAWRQSPSSRKRLRYSPSASIRNLRHVADARVVQSPLHGDAG